MRNFIVTLFFSFFSISQAGATIYIVARDPGTHKTAIAAISSGPVVSYTDCVQGKKDVGLVGWSGGFSYGWADINSKVLAMMASGSSTSAIENYVASQIGDGYSRYIFINANGDIGHVFPPSGCRTPECGAIGSRSQDFFVMGGGLLPNVVRNTVAAFEPIHANQAIPLECRILQGLQIVIAMGGEMKDFEQAKIGFNDPAKAEQQWYTSTIGEAGIIDDLHEKMKASGVNCTGR